MAAYEPPLSGLLELGRPDIGSWGDYATRGIGPEHVPDLIRMMLDEDLLDWDEEEEPPSWYAHIHAWRALGHLRAEAAVEPLLDLIVEDDAADGFDDWVVEEVPEVLGRIGVPALVPTAERLLQMHYRPFAPGSFAQALEKIAKGHPETRPQVVAHLIAFLERAPENDAAQNGFIISTLIDLNAVEAWPVIEKAFDSGSVDPWIVGDAAEVKFRLGLGPKPLPRRRWTPPALAKPGQPNARERAETRAKKRKAEKRKQKKR